jgi:mannose-6-phosphate isomerase
MQNVLYFKPIYKEKIWGGEKLRDYLNREIPKGKIGESWEVSDYGTDLSVIENGEWKGRTLRDVFKNEKTIAFGNHFENTNEFPLLVKIIDAEDKLSVQVHPDDKYALEKDPESSGKKEAWYVLESLPDAEIVCGFSRDLDRETYRKEITENHAENSLRRLKVKKGDSFLITPGTVHAIGAGTLILEVQQSSDSTYRVYDYGRLGDDGKPRPLHLDKALDVLNYKKSDNKELLKGETFAHALGERNILCVNDKFRFEKWTWDGEEVFPSMTSIHSFQIVHVTKGDLKLSGEFKTFRKGDSFLVTKSALDTEVRLNAKSAEFLMMGVGTDWVN